MRKQTLAFVSLAFLAGNIAAADGGAGKAPVSYLYKYKNDKGVMVIENAIPPEYARKGYQVITRSGQLVQDVPASNEIGLDPEVAKKKREEAAMASRRDGELRRLYSAPADAERMRNRQMDAITLKIDFAKGQLAQMNSKRKQEVEQAAKVERKGGIVPPHMKESIGRLDRQVADQEAQIKTLEADKEKIRAEFDPVIERLKVIYPDKATPATPTAPVAVPATPAAPAAR